MSEGKSRSKILDCVSLIVQPDKQTDLTAEEQRQAKLVFWGLAGVFSIWYGVLLYTSNKKWFHIAWLVLVVFTLF